MRVPLTLLRPWLPQDYRLLEDPGQPLLALPLTFLAFILLRRQGAARSMEAVAAGAGLRMRTRLSGGHAYGWFAPFFAPLSVVRKPRWPSIRASQALK